VLGLFLLGLWLTRAGILTDVERWSPLLRRLLWTCLPLGFALSVLHATRRMGIEADGALYAAVTAAYAGLAITAGGMVAGLALLLTGRGGRVVSALAPMGRMALTGYLASNAIGAAVFYGWGLGQMDRLSITAMNTLALAIFIGLSLFSAAWLRTLRFGPVEWLWRSVSYVRLQPLRRR
jgi:uncharacterized protein